MHDLIPRIAELRDYFPQIQDRLKPDVAAAAKKGAKERLDLAEKEAEEEQSRHRKTMRELRDYAEPHEGKIRTQETLHDADLPVQIRPTPSRPFLLLKFRLADDSPTRPAESIKCDLIVELREFRRPPLPGENRSMR